jgi:hypothetical protein
MRNSYDHTAVVMLHLHGGEVMMEVFPCRTAGGVFNDFAGTQRARELRDFWNEISPDGTIGQDWFLR